MAVLPCDLQKLALGMPLKTSTKSRVEATRPLLEGLLLLSDLEGTGTDLDMGAGEQFHEVQFSADVFRLDSLLSLLGGCRGGGCSQAR